MTRYKSKIRKGDFIVVLSGDDRGKVGKVLKLMPSEERLMAQGINLVTKHKKGVNGQPGEVIKQESSLHISNVALFDNDLGVKTKVKFEIRDNVKVRVGKKTNKVY